MTQTVKYIFVCLYVHICKEFTRLNRKNSAKSKQRLEQALS
jgi:hypothetical protein